MAPCRIRLLDEIKQEITTEVPGYRPFRAGVEHTPAGWRWKGINFGPCVTIAIDVSVGGIYSLTKEQYIKSVQARGGRAKRRYRTTFTWSPLTSRAASGARSPHYVATGRLGFTRK